MCVDPAQAHSPHIAFRFLLRIHQCLASVLFLFRACIFRNARTWNSVGAGLTTATHGRTVTLQ